MGMGFIRRIGLFCLHTLALTLACSALIACGFAAGHALAPLVLG